MADRMFLDAMKKKFEEIQQIKILLTITLADGNNPKGKESSLKLVKK